MSNENQIVTDDQIAKIRSLTNFDIVILISEIHYHGWLAGASLLALMPASEAAP